MLKRNIIANYAGTAWNAAMSLAFVPLYIKFLGAESYGLIGVSAMLNAYMAFFTIGLSPMVGREVARYRGGVHSAEAIRSLLRVVELVFIGIGVTCIAALWTGAPWIASNWLNLDSLNADSVAHALRIMSAVIGLRFLEGLYNSALGGLQRQVTANILVSLTATLRGVGSIAVLAWWSPTIDAFFWWQGLVACLGTLAAAICTYAYMPPARVSPMLGFACLRDGWPFARGMLLASFLSLAVMQTDKLLLTRLLDLADYGRYSLAVSVAASLALLTVPIHSAFYPRFIELLASGRRSDASREFHRAAQLVSVVTGSVGIVLMFFADRVLLLWTGSAGLADAVAGPLRLLLLGYLFNALGAMPYALQLAAGRTALTNWIGAACVVVSVPTLIYVVPRAGIMGAALVWLCVTATTVAVFVPILARQTSLFTIRAWLVGDAAGPTCAAAAMCGLIWLGSYLLPSSAGAVAAVLVIALVTSTAAALAVAPDVRVACSNFLSSRLAPSKQMRAPRH